MVVVEESGTHAQPEGRRKRGRTVKKHLKD